LALLAAFAAAACVVAHPATAQRNNNRTSLEASSSIKSRSLKQVGFPGLVPSYFGAQGLLFDCFDDTWEWATACLVSERRVYTTVRWSPQAALLPYTCRCCTIDGWHLGGHWWGGE